MTTVTINLTQATLDTLASYRATTPTPTLGARVDQFIRADYLLASAHNYYEELALTPPTGWILFPDGGYQLMAGVSMATPGAATGTFTVTALDNYLPDNFILQYKGQLKYAYTTNASGQLSLTGQGSTLSSMALQTTLSYDSALFDPVMANQSSVLNGALAFTAGGAYSGTVTSITGSADAFLASSSVTGNFTLSGSSATVGAGTASSAFGGTLTAFSQQYVDGSAVQVSGPLAVDAGTRLDEQILSQSAYFTGNDVINVSLPAAPATAWVIDAGNGDDQVTIQGGGAKLSALGGNGNDVIKLGDSGHAVNGGAGVDTVVLGGARASYAVSNGASGVTLTSAGGVDTLAGVERLQFSDATVALDVGGTSGQVYRLYQAAFDRTPDSVGVGYWMKMKDLGLSLSNMATGFVTSAEFQKLYGVTPSNGALVTSFYHNALHREPDQGGYNYWLDLLDRKVLTTVDMLVFFSESAENQAAVAQVIGNGFAYTPYLG